MDAINRLVRKLRKVGNLTNRLYLTKDIHQILQFQLIYSRVRVEHLITNVSYSFINYIANNNIIKEFKGEL